ncbi:NUDIX hydrolase [Zhihengliuella halotolerans]|uniref:NUDIX hydrolase n=1 Tax=Zhihengliuella halotolerans TaxID=370736 RepID=UPI000C7FE3D0|nr:NUDIX domain-containing protein [Zhihengliuella halotolerans]
MPTLLTVAAVVVYDSAGRILLVRKRGTSKYMQPGGKLEQDEAPVQAAIRELHEELGLTFTPGSLTDRGQWRGAAANEPGTELLAYVFDAALADAVQPDGGPVHDAGSVTVRAELEDALWVAPAVAAEREDLAPLLTESILPRLIRSPEHLARPPRQANWVR